MLVQFWATWCHPCRMVSPVVEELAAERSGELDVVKVDLDEEFGLAVQHRGPPFPPSSSTSGAGRWARGPAPRPGVSWRGSSTPSCGPAARGVEHRDPTGGAAGLGAVAGTGPPPAARGGRRRGAGGGGGVVRWGSARY
ncbi:thioredoxin family protein [Kitasatospora putterlickiae]|uniref:thioredoxin family protein n=1 Tax=Kitasatospora putterlickiae TaxID=221725 RepID=UPI0031D2A8AF